MKAPKGINWSPTLKTSSQHKKLLPLRTSEQNRKIIAQKKQKMPQRKNNRFMNGRELLDKAVAQAHGKTYHKKA